MENLNSLFEEATLLLKSLIEIPSFSKEEQKTGDQIEDFLKKKGVEVNRSGNNIWAFSGEYNPVLPTLWLNSHHDTVKPNAGYTKNPFSAIIEDGKLFGLGSNDAGGSLVSLIAAFTHFIGKALPFNLLFIASAEEEISGANGISSILTLLPEAELAIVGEPTQMRLAVAEKGLLVIDAKIHGKSGHAAREEGVNAIYLALEDLEEIRNFQFMKSSPFLGRTKVSATIIRAGHQHNVVPDLCEYTLDVRVTDAYTLQEAFEELKSNLKAELTPRSMRLQSSHLPDGHLMYRVADKLELEKFGSPTLSDQALIPWPSVKIGPGDSARSHSADEFIYLEELRKGIEGYIAIIKKYAELS
ncbi:M20 family metallo-hydrolase [Algoriphagus boritolerans]|uniref:Acetylornithine deacetylase n=1 Tax=Algoriphagus boritolerans DSM 17298 = JCM 18970 TaxID=1120964 RepID=A0A1H5XNY0_9BACT|nr:M20 family metallo-hydrolase [Algoriphagus boritolerans]SEG12946.1 acetylornithine deacetylase [Algoriphagus boritolerans DSM 17298 = JCM 18970]